jgi:hypothetical protein
MHLSVWNDTQNQSPKNTAAEVFGDVEILNVDRSWFDTLASGKHSPRTARGTRFHGDRDTGAGFYGGAPRAPLTWGVTIRYVDPALGSGRAPRLSPMVRDRTDRQGMHPWP